MLVKVSELQAANNMVARSKNGYDYKSASFEDSASTVFSMPTATSIVEGLFNKEDYISIRALCRDMLLYDPICGGAVELFASLPFGQFSLSGLPDLEMIQKFQDCLKTIKVESLFTPMSIDYLVDGAATGALNVDPVKKIVDYYIPLNLDDCKIWFVPGVGETPLIDASFPKEYREVFSKKNDPRVEELKQRIPSIIRKELIDGGTKELNQQNGVYIARGGMSHQRRGLSLFNSLLPYWILEKALLRGTIQMAYRRQRGILVIQMGSDTWPTNEDEMNHYVNTVISADRDPTGAVIALRHDVSFQEIRQGGDFWKHGDTIEVYNQLKQKALGISEGAFSGDASVGATESVMTIFNQRLRQLRENMVRGLLTEKIFPLVSQLNDYKRDDVDTASLKNRYKDIANMTLESGYKYMDGYYYNRTRDKMFESTAAAIDNGKYYIPSLNFHTSLRPEANSEYMSMLDTLTKMGVPVPLRTIVGSMGLNIGDIIAGQDEDIELHKVFDSYRKKVEKYKPKMETNDFGSIRTSAWDTLTPASSKRLNLMKRKDQFEDYNDKAAFIDNGKRLTTKKGRTLQDERRNKVLAQASANVAKLQNHEARLAYLEMKEKGVI